MTRAFLVLLLTLAHLPIAAAPRRRAVMPPPRATAPSTVAAAASQAAQKALAAGVPAVQIAVSRRGEIIYSAAFGVSDRESATAATPRSVMQAGSIMKQFTAAGILRLAERGALTLDDRIETFVPEFNPRGATITLRHLLTHTSGISALAPSDSSPLTRQGFITFINAQPFVSAPGSKWAYNNSGFRLLGYAIESITAMPFAEFVHREFAMPLGLIDTGICGSFSLPLPEGYGLLQGNWTRMQAVEPSVSFAAGSLCSTTADLVRWAHLLATGRVVLPDSYAAMTTPYRLTDNTLVPYGLGLTLSNQLGRPAVWHTGGIDGFLSSLVYFPDDDIAVSAIINALPAPAGVTAHSIAISVANAALGAP